MSSSKYWKPLTIAGAVLLLNSFVFLVITVSMQSSMLWGPAAACLIAGVPILIVGLTQKTRLSGK
jgi:hypothetical protein